MEISLREIIGLEIHVNQENCGFLRVVLIKDANGKVAGILNDNKKFFSVENIALIQRSVILSSCELGTSEGKNWLGLKVETRSGKRKGKVSNVFFDENLTQVKKIEVKKKILGFFNKKIILPSNLIFEVQKNKIIIIDDTQKAVEIKLAPSGA